MQLVHNQHCHQRWKKSVSIPGYPAWNKSEDPKGTVPKGDAWGIRKEFNMSLDTFITIVCFAGLVVGCVGYRFFSENVKLTYKDQRVGGGRHG